MSSRLVDTERQCRANAQYSRRETLEIVELPKSLTNDKAETKVCQIFRSLDCNVDKEDLDACHWLKDKERVIVKFFRRKDCEKVLKAKNDLLKLSTTMVHLPEESLLTKDCALTTVCFGQQAKNYVVRAESINIKLLENSRPLCISHMEDFKKYFPDVDFHSL